MNKFPRYITIFSITILGMTLSLSLGNPLCLYKNIKI